MDELGRVLTGPGEVVHVDGWTIEVLEVAHHAPTRVSFRPTLMSDLTSAITHTG